MAHKRERKTLSIEDKIKILGRVDSHVGSRVSLARELGIPISTLNTVVKARKTIETSAVECGPSAKRRKYVKYSKYDELEEILKEWFQCARASNIPISGVILKEKAQHVAMRLGIEDFKASNGWLSRFKIRYNVVYRSICGESNSVDPQTVVQWKEHSLSQHIEGYAPKDIFNLDETGLFFNVLPHKTLDFKGESCHGGKHSKARLTVLLGANASGSEKLRPFVIGKSKNPRCFKNIKTFPTTYAANTKAWMTSHVFQEQMQALDAKMGGQNRKILVFLDQCPAHPNNMNLRNIKLVFFPPNCTSQLQPLDLGIIHVFKANYRRILVRKAMNLIDSGRDPKSFKVTVFDALHYIARSWKEVDAGKISNCFKKAGFNFSQDCTLEQDQEQDNEESLEEGEGSNRAMGDNDQLPLFGAEISFSDFVGVDEQLTTSNSLTIDEAIDLHNSEEAASEEDDDDDTETPKESTINAISAVHVLRLYLSSVAGSENELELLDRIEKRVESIHTNKMSKQSKIMEYFQKEDS